MIKDSALRNAAETVMAELENQEQTIMEQQGEIEDLQMRMESQAVEIDQAMGDIEDLNARILELEEALAEAHLTGHICEECARRSNG